MVRAHKVLCARSAAESKRQFVAGQIERGSLREDARAIIHCLRKYSAAFSGSMVEISICVPISNPAQIEVFGKIVQCQ